MNARSIICIFMSIALLNIVSAADVEGGVNVEPVIEDTIFSDITHTETTTDLEDWEITLTLNDDAFNNNTTFELWTQMCNNDGVCLPPNSADLSTDDNKVFNAAVTTIEDHSYVNWEVKVTYNDDNTSEQFPPSGWYKTWSDCYYTDGEWGGSACSESEDDSFLPAVGLLMTVGTLAIAAITRFE